MLLRLKPRPTSTVRNSGSGNEEALKSTTVHRGRLWLVSQQNGRGLEGSDSESYSGAPAVDTYRCEFIRENPWL